MGKRFGFLRRPFGGGPESGQQEDEDEHTASKTKLRHKTNRMTQSEILMWYQFLLGNCAADSLCRGIAVEFHEVLVTHIMMQTI
jgi:hypothetical protein